MANNNGVISAPISLEADVYSVLGLEKTGDYYDVGYVCSNSHGKINQWSLYKPIAAGGVGELSEQDFYDYNFGYTIPSYSSYTAMRQGISNGDVWIYGSPESDIYWKRLTDFNGYDHNATAPFALTLESGSPRLDGTGIISTPRDVYWLTNWGRWQGYQDTNAQYLNCGIYVPGVGYYPFTDTDQGITIAELDSDGLSFDVPSTLFSTGQTYQVYLVLTTWDGQNGPRQWYTPGESEGGTWWPLTMDEPLSFTCQAAYSPLDYITLTISDALTTLDLTKGYAIFTDTSFTATARMSSGYTGSGTLGVMFYAENVLVGTTSQSVLIGSMGATSFTGGSSATESIAYASALEYAAYREQLTVRALITFASGVNSYSKEQTFSIEATTTIE